MKTKLHLATALAGLILAMLAPVRSDAQFNWQKYEDNPILEGEPGSWNEGMFYPAVFHENGLFHLWYCGWLNSERQIGHAFSEDGISWEMDPDPAIPGGLAGSWDHHKYPGTVLRIDDTLRMWYHGSTNSSADFAIGYAWYDEPEGEWITFEDPVMEHGETGTWDALLVLKPAVYFDGSAFHMYYTGMGSDLSFFKIGHATSPDGINWEKDYENSPVLTVGDPGSWDDQWLGSHGLVHYNDTLRMFYEGYSGAGAGWDGYMQVGYAWSDDYITWHKETIWFPVLPSGPQYSWDELWTGSPVVLVHQGQLKMWYTGLQAGLNLRIGLALGDMVYTCLPGGITFTSQEEIDNFPADHPFCKIVEGSIEINGADITNLDSLDALERINGNLSILDCSSLISIKGLHNVTAVEGFIKITGNNALERLSGLDAIQPETITGLSIYDNNSLYICDASAICDYLGFNAVTDIHDNAPGCNSEEQVQAACDIVTVEALSLENTFIIYPNPLESTTSIEYLLTGNSPVTLKILDLSGREMKTLVKEVQQQGEQRVIFNTAGLPAGIYFCVLKTSEGVQTKKIIKL